MYEMEQVRISSIPEISAIYYALLQCGYEFYSMERGGEHIREIRRFLDTENVPAFFSDAAQKTCDVYPYWPRAAILETATFYLDAGCSGYQNFDKFYDQIMTAGNIADEERGVELWNWIDAFPKALKEVLNSPGFAEYLEWEAQWMAKQNRMYKAELNQIFKCVKNCSEQYQSKVKKIQIIINPIKCVYSADYHMDGDCFVFSSGDFRAGSIVHEFLHHVVHPYVTALKDQLPKKPVKYPGVDESYYLSGDETGMCNAFEEFAVRALTQRVLADDAPTELMTYLEGLL